MKKCGKHVYLRPSCSDLKGLWNMTVGDYTSIIPAMAETQKGIHRPVLSDTILDNQKLYPETNNINDKTTTIAI